MKNLKRIFRCNNLKNDTHFDTAMQYNPHETIGNFYNVCKLSELFRMLKKS